MKKLIINKNLKKREFYEFLIATYEQTHNYCETMAIIERNGKCYLDLKTEPIWWYHPDHLGSSSYLTDYSGLPSHYYNYLPFGEEMVSQNTSSYNNKYRFSGKELDEETGLSYFGARYYNPKWSVWLGVDPEYAKFPNWSPYNYCLNNPLNVIDPDGRDIIYIIWKSETEIKSQYIYSKGNFWLMKNVDGKMVKTNQRYDPGKQSVSKTMYKLLESYRKIEASNDKVLKKQLKTLETSKNKHYQEEIIGSEVSGCYTYPLNSQADKGKSQGTQTQWNFNKNSLDSYEIETDPLALVCHETRHQYDYEIANMKDSPVGEANAKDPAEIRATNNENRGRKISKLPMQTKYNGERIDPILLKNPPNNR